MVEWKIITYNNKYEVSNTGLIRRIDSQHILQGCITGGYRSVKLTFEHSKQKRFYVHRLVAEHFLQQDNDKKIFVNHKDGNKLNNCVENLEWVTPRENNLHYYKEIQEKKKEKRKYNNKPIPVIQLTLNDEYIATFSSMNQAHKITGISVVQIKRCIDGEINHTGNYKWIRQQ